MKTNPTSPSKTKGRKVKHPFEVVKAGSISIPICSHANIIPKRHPHTGATLYESLRHSFISYRLALQLGVRPIA